MTANPISQTAGEQFIDNIVRVTRFGQGIISSFPDPKYLKLTLLCPPLHPYTAAEAATQEDEDGTKYRKPKKKKGGERKADPAATAAAATIAADEQKGEKNKMKGKKMKEKKGKEKKGKGKKGEEVKERAAAGSAAAANEGEDVDVEGGGKALKLHQKRDDKGNGGPQEV